MSRSPSDIDFRTRPLAALDHHLATRASSFWILPSVLCVADPGTAKAVLANSEGTFREHSDFFHTRRGAFGPRCVQRALADSSRRCLTRHAAAHAPRLAADVEAVLTRGEEWPDAANHLLYLHFHECLLRPDREEAMAPWLDAIVRRGVLAGARRRHGRLSRALFRRRAFRRLRREVERRAEERRQATEASAPPPPPADLFDVLAEPASQGVPSRDLSELYVPYLFAVVGSVGFLLAWSVYLLATHPPTAAPSRCVVREALRLWPVAWQLLRHPAREQRLDGCPVGPRHGVLVSPYVTHRHPDHWPEANRFRPERWSNGQNHRAFLPFGWGPHTCAAASLSMDVAERTLDLLRRRYAWHFTVGDPRPILGPSLAPPRFRLDLSPRSVPDSPLPEPVPLERR